MTSILTRPSRFDDSYASTLSGIVFVSDRCLFGHGAVLDLMSWWAKGLRNERHLAAKIADARGELARGTDRAAVIRSVTTFFAGVEDRRIQAATRAYLASPRSRFSIPGLLLAQAVAPSPDVEIVLVSELALSSVAAEIPGVHSVVCSTLDRVNGRLTGDISLIADTADRRRAMAGFQEERSTAAADCTFLHRGDAVDTAVHGVAGASVAIRERVSLAQ